MPMRSIAQNRFMRWADSHPKDAQAERGIKPAVVKEFVASAHGHSLANLPERVQHKAEGGTVTSYAPLFRW
jgi:hypothetical protein